MNITLVGMAGVGKSAVGRALAEKLRYKFIDIDEIIKNESGMKLQEIIDKSGEEKLLAMEESAVLHLGDIDNCIISPGGSIIYSEKAMEFLKSKSKIIFLDAPLELIEERIANQEPRGVVGLRSKSVKEVYAERMALYKKWADKAVAAKKQMSIDDIISVILNQIQDFGL